MKLAGDTEITLDIIKIEIITLQAM